MWQRLTSLFPDSVVQRQLWLMENEALTKQQAYDHARREFYELRQKQDIERRIALEEARYVGAYFGKNTLQIISGLEDKQFNRWRTWAAAEIARLSAAQSQAYTSVVEIPEDMVDEAGANPADQLEQ